MESIFFRGVNTEEEVLAILKTCQANAGLAVTQWSSEGTSVVLSYGLPMAVLAWHCKKFLQDINPALYGYRATQTSVKFGL